MKSTGIVRKMDNLGRIVLPMEIRTTFDIGPKDDLEIFVEGDRIILQKYSPCCPFCGSKGESVTFEGKRICKECAKKISELL